MDEAGFPDGKYFPVIRLVINRNDTQQRVAKSVARMWKQNLNIETEIVVKDAGELEMARKSGEFDLVRRGVVLPTADEAVSFKAIFDTDRSSAAGAVIDAERTGDRQPAESPGGREPESPGDQPASVAAPEPAVTEDDAIYELRAIPLYFPTSFSLIRPYVSGFEMNSLDALTLSNVMIDNDWQPKNANGESR